MELKSAAELLQRMADSSGNQYRDVQLSVRIFKPGMIGGTPCVPVKRLDQGFDWDAGKVLITPDVELTTLTAEEVADIRKSVADGQSWHAHQVQKKLRDERDELRAKVEELEQTIAANALGQAEIDVVHERRRQVHAKGWTPEHDDEHDDCSLAAAAACYIIGSSELTYKGAQVWPRGWNFKGPITGENYRRALVKGAALALAEIERIDRAADKKGGDQ